MKSKRPEDWTAEEKLKVVGEYEKLDEQQKGKYLRERKGCIRFIYRDGSKSLSRRIPPRKRSPERETGSHTSIRAAAPI